MSFASRLPLGYNFETNILHQASGPLGQSEVMGLNTSKQGTYLHLSQRSRGEVHTLLCGDTSRYSYLSVQSHVRLVSIDSLNA